MRGSVAARLIALTILARDGVFAIWALDLSAAGAYRDGHNSLAAGIIDIADATERNSFRIKAAVQG